MKKSLMLIMLCTVMCLLAANAPVSAKGRGDNDYTELTLGVETRVFVSEPGDSAWLRFVPAEEGVYAFKSLSQYLDTHGSLFDENMNLLKENDDHNGYGFLIACTLKAGKTYYLEVGLDENSAGYFSVLVVSVPKIASVTAADVTIEEGDNGHIEIDESSGEEWFFYNDTAPGSITVTTEDETQFSGTPDEVVDEMFREYGVEYKYDYYFCDDQDHGHQFIPGNTYPAVFDINGKTASYGVTIEENVIRTIEAEDAAVYEKSEGYEDGEEGEEWFHYYDVCSERITVTTRDGTVFSGEPGAVCRDLYSAYHEYFSYYFYFVKDQNTEHFEAGNAYEAVIEINGKKACYQVTILKDPIISVEAEDAAVYECSSGSFHETDGQKWFYYNCVMPGSIKVETEDGTFSGDVSSVNEALYEKYNKYYNCNFWYSASQSLENRFSAGESYDAVFEIGEITVPYRVTIEETPVDSVEAADMIIYDSSAYMKFNEETGEEWPFYDCELPDSIIVRTKDGSTYSGSVRNVTNQLYSVYGVYFGAACYFADIQDYENQFSVGNSYEAILLFGGKSIGYSIEILPDLNQAFTLNKENLTLPVFEEETLTATGVTGIEIPVIWRSLDESVATVDENGTVTALKYGNCDIMATTENGEHSAFCAVQTLFWDVAGSPNKEDDDYQYYYTPVYWAAERSITRGYDLEYFGVGLDCKREEFILFLYRLAGQPSVSLSGLDSTFSDVSGLSGSFRKAIAWGNKLGISKGYTSGENKGKFGVGFEITRREAMIMLWRYAGQPAPSASGLKKARSFTDVKGKYKETTASFQAIAWASGAGIANGYTNAASLPEGSGLTVPCYGCDLHCLREQMITFLYRYADP